MSNSKTSKKAVREYPKNTFKVYQDAKVSEREQAIHEILVLLGRSGLKFANITMLAEHVSALLNKGNKSTHPSTLIRKRNMKGEAGAPNPYRMMLQQYLLGKYLSKGKAPIITKDDIAEIRLRYPAVDAYCAQKEGDCKNYKEQTKLLAAEIEDFKKGSKSLPQRTNTDSYLSVQLDKTVTALVRLVTELNDFVAIDWGEMAIVDTAYDCPKVLVGPELLPAFFEALEKSGMKPSEGR